MICDLDSKTKVVVHPRGAGGAILTLSYFLFYNESKKGKQN